MPKITKIRADVDVVSHLNYEVGYLKETRDCERYEKKVCRVCDKPRLNLSPWCHDHFPWEDRKPKPLYPPTE